MLTTLLFKFSSNRPLASRLTLVAALLWQSAALPSLAQSSFQETSGVELPAGGESSTGANSNQPQNNNNQVTNPNYWGDAKNMTGGQYGTYRNPYTGTQPASNGQSLSYRPNTQGLGGTAQNSGGSSGGFSPMRMGMMGLGAASLGMRGMSRMGRHMPNQGSASEKQMAKMEERRHRQEEKMRKELEKAQREAEDEHRKQMSKLDSPAPELSKKKVEGDLLNEKAEDSF